MCGGAAVIIVIILQDRGVQKGGYGHHESSIYSIQKRSSGNSIFRGPPFPIKLKKRTHTYTQNCGLHSALKILEKVSFYYIASEASIVAKSKIFEFSRQKSMLKMRQIM